MKKYMRLTSSALALLASIAVQSSNAEPFSIAAGDTPLPIPPSGTGTGTTVSAITVPSESGLTSINDLNVFVDLDHTWTSDLEITIKHVDTGTTAMLFNHDGDSGDDITDVTFDDDGNDRSISTGSPPFGPGSFVPLEPLGIFEGESIEGTWTLTVADGLGGDNGTLYSFRIEGDASSPSEAPVLTSIDIKPGSDTNPINLRSRGVDRVAILTTADFDANSVDADTVRFGAAPPQRWTLEDVDDDTDWDLVFYFNTRETDIVCGDTEATVKGHTLDGVQIMGTDSITTVGCNQ